jgi:hypothetical protein
VRLHYASCLFNAGVYSEISGGRFRVLGATTSTLILDRDGNRLPICAAFVPRQLIPPTPMLSQEPPRLPLPMS